MSARELLPRRHLRTLAHRELHAQPCVLRSVAESDAYANLVLPKGDS